MKKIILVLFMFLFALPAFSSFDDVSTDLYEMDLSNIDNPFNGQKLVTEKEFNDAIEKRKQLNQRKTKGFWAWVFKHTLPKEMIYEEPKPFEGQNLSNEYKAYNETANKKPSLTLGVNVVDTFGETIKRGHYQLSYQDNYILFIQGSDVLGKMRAFEIKSDFNSDEIVYAKAISVNDKYLKVLYSSAKNSYVGFLKVAPNF